MTDPIRMSSSYSRGTRCWRRTTDTVDADILERLTAGDGSGVDALVQRYGARVLRLALGITGGRADAQEVAQDVFLAVAQKYRSFERRGALGTWIYRITVNAALNKRRGQRRAIEIPTTSGSSPALVDPGARPDAGALSRQRVRAVIETIRMLPEPYRRVIQLQIDGWSAPRMADTLQISTMAVKSRLHRARLLLLSRLAQDIRLAGVPRCCPELERASSGEKHVRSRGRPIIQREEAVAGPARPGGRLTFTPVHRLTLNSSCASQARIWVTPGFCADSTRTWTVFPPPVV